MQRYEGCGSPQAKILRRRKGREARRIVVSMVVEPTLVQQSGHKLGGLPSERRRRGQPTFCPRAGAKFDATNAWRARRTAPWPDAPALAQRLAVPMSARILAPKRLATIRAPFSQELAAGVAAHQRRVMQVNRVCHCFGSECVCSLPASLVRLGKGASCSEIAQHACRA